MIGLCASYLSNLIKVKWMNEMIESWISQSHNVPLYISISIDENLESIFYYYLNNKWNNKDLFFYVTKEKLSQFQHYKKLCDLLLEKYDRNTWIVFTDDDDIWDKDRVLYYKTLVENLKKMGKENSVSHIQIPTHCVNYKNQFDDNYSIRNFEHIETADSTHKHLDYWQFSCQLKYLKNFIEQTSPILINDGFCNLYFVKYFYNKKTPVYRWYTKNKNRFVYYWRGSAGYNINDNDNQNNDVHLLEKLKKKSAEEAIIKVFLQERINSDSIKEKNKDKITNYIEKTSKLIQNFDNQKMEQEIYKLFNSDKYDPYINSPILEGVIE